MKYARYIVRKKRRETWEELVDRNKKMHLKKYPALAKEINDVYANYVLTKKILPSMRSMQFAGKPIEISPNRIYNCSYVAMDHWLAFGEIMFELLSGVGVGFSVQKHHIENLPEITKPNAERERRYLIGDSIEGWAEAIKVLMKSYFFGGSSIRFDYSDIRGKGERLVTSGGKAPGADPLRICIEHVKSILNSKENGQQLTSIEVHDIVCHIADAVLAGGIRRAALLSLFSADDAEMIAAKSGNWYEANPQRGRANNSASLVRHKITKEFFFDLWERIKQSGAGEPGIFFTNDKDFGCNPCCEIALRSEQHCVSGDTKLITKAGITNIKDAVGTNVEIWNGTEWCSVVPFQTGTADKLYRVWFSDGSYLDVTSNHKFLVKNRFETTYREVDTLQIIDLLKIQKYKIGIPRANIEYPDNAGISEPNAYDYGFVLGDGWVTSSGHSVNANLHSTADKNLKFKTASIIGEYKLHNGNPYTTLNFDIDVNFVHAMKYNFGLPTDIFTWDRKSILQFIAGWADADGSNASNGIRIYGREDKIRDLQLLLSKVGINASVNLMQRAGTPTNLGTRRNDVWYCQIVTTNEIPSQRLKCTNAKSALGKGKYQLIDRIDELPELHESFCLTEPTLHQCVFNNVLTKQCNLCEVNVSDVETQEELNDRVKAATFIGTLQAGYTDFHYLRPSWKRVTEKEALLGIGLTGIASGNILKLNPKQAAKIAKDENERVAALIGINKAARITTVKPSGTTSTLLGTSSGVHAWHGQFYIRRIRVGKNEAIYDYLAKNHPELIEDEYFRPHDTAVISVPIKAPEGAIMRTESPIQLLERVKWLHENWIKPGHRTGSNTHNVSATISIREHEWDAVGTWMWDNREHYSGISVLPFDGGNYKQAPFEEIDEAKYNEMLKNLHGIDLSKVIELDDETTLMDQAACSGNSCEII